MHSIIDLVGNGPAIAAFDTTPMENITSAVGTGLQTVSNDAMTLIGTVLPYALAVVGAVLVVTIGIKVFKRIAGK